MKYILKLILIIMVIAVIFFGARTTFKEQEENVTEENNQEIKGINIEDLEPVSKVETNQDKEVIKEKIENNEKVILYFYADWCGMCKEIATDMDKIIEENKDIEIIRIDTDIEKDIKEEYDITAVPTFVLLNNKEEIERIVEVTDTEQILEFIKK